jgi:hypothetical protein
MQNKLGVFSWFFLLVFRITVTSHGIERKEAEMDSSVPHLTRRGVLGVAKELGLPISKGTLDKKCMEGRGPIAVGQFNGRHVYRREDVLAWLRGLISPVDGH